MGVRELTWGGGWGDHQLLLDGKPVGDFDQSTFRERATVRFNGEEWNFTKEFGGDVLATKVGEGLRMTAQKGGIFTSRWEVGTTAGVYQLRGWGRSLEVSLGDVVLGHSESAGTLTDRRRLQLEDSVPLRHHVFLLWVVTVDVRRKSSSGDSGAGG